MIEALEADLGIPVVTSNQASLWAALRAAGIQARLEGYGRLMRE
jgi:maleate cis-trans isomerase